MTEWTLSLKPKGSKKRATSITLDEEEMQQIVEWIEGERCTLEETLYEFLENAKVIPKREYNIECSFVVTAKSEDEAWDIANEYEGTMNIEAVEEKR